MFFSLQRARNNSIPRNFGSPDTQISFFSLKTKSLSIFLYGQSPPLAHTAIFSHPTNSASWRISSSVIASDSTYQLNFNAAFGPAEIGPAEIGLAKIGPAEIGPAEIGPAKIGTAEIGLAEIGPAEIGTAEIGLAKIGLAKIGPAEIGTAEIGPAEIGPAEIGPAVVANGICNRLIFARY